VYTVDVLYGDVLSRRRFVCAPSIMQQLPGYGSAKFLSGTVINGAEDPEPLIFFRLAILYLHFLIEVP
jgi:hypothetical protein